MEKNIHLQMWKKFGIYSGKLFTTWASSGNAFLLAFVEANTDENIMDNCYLGLLLKPLQ